LKRLLNAIADKKTNLDRHSLLQPSVQLNISVTVSLACLKCCQQPIPDVWSHFSVPMVTHMACFAGQEVVPLQASDFILIALLVLVLVLVVPKKLKKLFGSSAQQQQQQHSHQH
jgi:hypothetical protein